MLDYKNKITETETGSMRKSLSEPELKVLATFSMILYESIYKSHQSKQNLEKKTKKVIFVYPINQKTRVLKTF